MFHKVIYKKIGLRFAKLLIDKVGARRKKGDGIYCVPKFAKTHRFLFLRKHKLDL